MRATSVIARFLSLLDVTLILLGLVMVMLAKAQIDPPLDETVPVHSESGILSRFIYVYPGWKGAEEGKCYELFLDSAFRWRKGRELCTEDDSDIKDLNGAHDGAGSGDTKPVLLMFSKDTWSGEWSQSRIEALRKTWGTPVIPLYNFFDQEPAR